MMVRSTCWATRASTPCSSGDVGDASQHLVLAATVDDRHVMGPLVTDDPADQPAPLREEGDQAAVDLIDLLADGSQASRVRPLGRLVVHQSIMANDATVAGTGVRPGSEAGRTPRRDQPTSAALRFPARRGVACAA